MNTLSPISQGIQGIQKGMEGLRRNASEIASNSREEVTEPAQQRDADDIASTMVDMKMNRQQVEMSAKVVKAADDMMGTLIDIKA